MQLRPVDAGPPGPERVIWRLIYFNIACVVKERFVHYLLYNYYSNNPAVGQLLFAVM
jgi:hypothetical protein